MNEGSKPNLWSNIRNRRKKGLPRKKPGQKGYPKTLDIGESALRRVVRSQILREWTFIEALYMRPDGIIPALVGLVKDMFAPSVGERLKETGDDVIIRQYQNFLGTLHLKPEYRAVWENYKQAQRRHASMDSDFDRAQDIRHPVGRAFNKLKRMVLGKFDELEETLSPENRDIWAVDVDEQRQIFMKIFSDWEKGKITTGRVLGMLDPKGIVESRKKAGHRLSEAGEMFAGRDLAQLQTTEVLTALETALMDLEDAGCPDDSDARAVLDEAMDWIDTAREKTNYDTSMLVQVVSDAVAVVRRCPHVSPRVAQRVADEIEIALDSSQETDRF